MPSKRPSAKQSTTPPEDRGARFTDGGRRREVLWRTWDYSRPELIVIGMNPSTADATQDDATITRLRNRARLLRLGGLRVVNLMDWIETNSSKLPKWASSQSPGEDGLCSRSNRSLLIRLVERSEMSAILLAAWGKTGQEMAPDVADEVVKTATQADKTIYCLGANADGSPKHPLYIKQAGWEGLHWYGGAPPF